MRKTARSINRKLKGLEWFHFIFFCTALVLLASRLPASGGVVREPYLQMLTPDSVTIVWRFDGSTRNDSRVQYGESCGNLNQVARGISVKPPSNDNENEKDRIVTITGLSPGTKYYYNVGTGVGEERGCDDNQYFTTAPPVGSAEPFSAWIVGDSGFNNDRQRDVRDAMLAATAINPPDIFLHVGDIDQDDGTDEGYTNKFFSIYNKDVFYKGENKDILRHTAFWPSPGNHDSDFYAQSRSGTRLPSDNDEGYVTRFTDVDPGDDGEVKLAIKWGGTSGNEYQGKYASAVMLKEMPPFTAYNDLAWELGQLDTDPNIPRIITKITSPNGGSGLDSSGELVDFSTGERTGVWLEVTGGSYIGGIQGTEYSGSPDKGDAHDIFSFKLDAMGSISYNSEDLVLTFSGMNKDKTYTLVFYGHRNDYGWDRASKVTISGADDFTNQSSAGAPISGPNNESTRLPADNDSGYVARFTDVKPGNDGVVVLTISWDGKSGLRPKGKYANAVMLQEESPYTAYNDLAWAPGQLDTDPNIPRHITKITSPNTRPSGGDYLSERARGELVNFVTGRGTGVILSIEGGWFDSKITGDQGKDCLQGDAHSIFFDKVDCQGVISYINEENSPLELTFSGLNPDKTYELVFYEDRDKYGDDTDKYGWKRASWVNISGADAFVIENQEGPYYEAFVLPKAGEAGGRNSGTEAYYSFDYANAHFIVLDSVGSDISYDSAESADYDYSTQLEWLENDINTTDKDWIIAYWHHPPYTKGSPHDSDNCTTDSDGRLCAMREKVLPILEAGGVDLVLSGHAHNYERSHLINGFYGFSNDPNDGDCQRDDNNCIIDPGYDDPDDPEVPPLRLYNKRGDEGTVYVVAGHGGKARATNTEEHPVFDGTVGAVTERKQEGSCILVIDGNTLTLRNLRWDGVITDKFSIKKSGSPDCPCLETAELYKEDWLLEAPKGQFFSLDETTYRIQINIEDGIGGVICGSTPFMVFVQSVCNFQAPKRWVGYYCKDEDWFGDVVENDEGTWKYFDRLSLEQFAICKERLKSVLNIEE